MENSNVYQSPESELETQELTQPIEQLKASKTLRFATYVLDVIFIYVFLFLVMFAAYMTLGDYQADRIVNAIPEFLLGYIAMFLYYLPQEALTGRTLAKLILGTKVVDEQSKPINTGKALGRTLGRMIPFEPFSFLGKSGRGWHDSIASTYVIKSR